MKANRAYELIVSRGGREPAFLSDPKRTDRIEIVSIDDGEVILYWNLHAKDASKLVRLLRVDLASLDAEEFFDKWLDADCGGLLTSPCPPARRPSSRTPFAPPSPMSAYSRRSPASPGSGSSRNPRSAAPTRTWRCRSAPARRSRSRWSWRRMLEVLALEPTDRVLDVGTGSGYHAALLSLLAGHVYTVERHPKLTAQAEQTLGDLGIANVTFKVGDGSEGWPEEAPFDAINVAAAIGDEPPRALEEQLANHGRMVAPVGTKEQHLMLSERSAERVSRLRLEAVQFVPLVRGRPRRA